MSDSSFIPAALGLGHSVEQRNYKLRKKSRKWSPPGQRTPGGRGIRRFKLGPPTIILVSMGPEAEATSVTLREGDAKN